MATQAYGRCADHPILAMLVKYRQRSLLLLPNEILRDIADLAANQDKRARQRLREGVGQAAKSLGALSATNKRLRAACMPVMVERLTLKQITHPHFLDFTDKHLVKEVTISLAASPDDVKEALRRLATLPNLVGMSLVAPKDMAASHEPILLLQEPASDDCDDHLAVLRRTLARLEVLHLDAFASGRVLLGLLHGAQRLTSLSISGIRLAKTSENRMLLEGPLRDALYELKHLKSLGVEDSRADSLTLPSLLRSTASIPSFSLRRLAVVCATSTAIVAFVKQQANTLEALALDSTDTVETVLPSPLFHAPFPCLHSLNLTNLFRGLQHSLPTLLPAVKHLHIRQNLAEFPLIALADVVKVAEALPTLSSLTLTPRPDRKKPQPMLSAEATCFLKAWAARSSISFSSGAAFDPFATRSPIISPLIFPVPPRVSHRALLAHLATGHTHGVGRQFHLKETAKQVQVLQAYAANMLARAVLSDTGDAELVKALQPLRALREAQRD
ncbi:hypothetical protein JCM10213_009204 [Rhodosporidiobolus nylandii]